MDTLPRRGSQTWCPHCPSWQSGSPDPGPGLPSSRDPLLHPLRTHPSSQGSPAASSATRISYSSAAKRSQSDNSGPSLSLSCGGWRERAVVPPRSGPVPPPRLPITPTHPEQGHLLFLLMVQVLLDVEEGVEEHVGQLAALQVLQRDPPCMRGAAVSARVGVHGGDFGGTAVSTRVRVHGGGFREQL